MSVKIYPPVQFCLVHQSWGEILCDDLYGEPCIWVTSEPPQDHRFNWDAQDEPSVEELEQMNENALSLRADFELLES